MVREALSSASAPWIAAKTRAASSALRHIGPIRSEVQARVIPPVRATLPNVGRRPVAPQTAEGATIDPYVSVPIANGTKPATVAEAEPADEPFDPCCKFHGFLVCPPNQISSIANSPIESLAIKTAPEFSNCWYTKASSSNT